MEYFTFTRTYAEEPERNVTEEYTREVLHEIMPFLKHVPSFDRMTIVVGVVKYDIIRYDS